MITGKVRIFYPADPVGVVPGGIDTFIRGILKWAPPSLDFSLVGMTTDTAARPVGRWTRCTVGKRTFDFFPVVAVQDAGGRGWLPLSLRFTVGAFRHRDQLLDDFDVFDFHRPEPSLLYLADGRPKNAYWHQDPKTIAARGSDNLWRRMPAGYEKLEARAVEQLSSAWCVRETGVTTLRERYPSLQDKVRFLPTWVDPEVFHPASSDDRLALRAQFAQEFEVATTASWIIFVGRLDTQKNPALLIEAFAKAVRRDRDAVLLLVGDGVLKRDLQRQAKAAGIADRVRFVGLLPQARIAKLLQASDLFALSSAYEGMPMALLEALGCGTPAVVTDVGEVRRVVLTGTNGMVVPSHDAQAFAQALVLALDGAAGWRDAAAAAVAKFQPAEVLVPVYQNYLLLSQAASKARHKAAQQDRVAVPPARKRVTVVGVPVDALRSSAVVGQIMRWGRQRESRAVAFCNVHSTVLAGRDRMHAWALRTADLVVPDGAPVAWTMRRKGRPTQDRVDGPGTMWRVCAAAQEHGVRVGLYGATPETLQALQANLARRFPSLQVAYSHAPPFREATAEEDAQVCQDVGRAHVGILLVGLGCPKQERWMAQQRGQMPAVMLGLGAAFDFHAGTLKRAPSWMRHNGLEWLHRLYSEPRRLLWRYVSSNTTFVWRTAGDVLGFAGSAAPVPSPFKPTVTVTHGERSVMAMAKELVDAPVKVSKPTAKPAPLTRAVSAAQEDAVDTGGQESLDAVTPRRSRAGWQKAVPVPAVARVTDEDADVAVAEAAELVHDSAQAEVRMSLPARTMAAVAPAVDDVPPDGYSDTGDVMSLPAQQRSIAELVARVDAEMPARRARVVGFLASQRGEGTSTLAHAYALANAETMGRNVLLLSSALPKDGRPSVIDAVRDGQRISSAFERQGMGLTEASLGIGVDGRRNPAWSLVGSDELWRALRESFDLVVVDIKSADVSDAALKVAPLCDGVVVVLEAARTRAPVVTQLLNNLQAVHARVLGTVLNKRRFHLPAKLYRWL